VTDNSRTIAATVVGAVAGGLAGYLFFTDKGRSVRRQLEPAFDDFARELTSFRRSIEKAAGAAGEGWKLLNEALGESGSSPRYPTTHQTSPY
jgi:gas vesicle protein